MWSIIYAVLCAGAAAYEPTAPSHQMPRHTASVLANGNIKQEVLNPTKPQKPLMRNKQALDPSGDRAVSVLSTGDTKTLMRNKQTHDRNGSASLSDDDPASDVARVADDEALEAQTFSSYAKQLNTFADDLAAVQPQQFSEISTGLEKAANHFRNGASRYRAQSKQQEAHMQDQETIKFSTHALELGAFAADLHTPDEQQQRGIAADLEKFAKLFENVSLQHRAPSLVEIKERMVVSRRDLQQAKQIVPGTLPVYEHVGLPHSFARVECRPWNVLKTRAECAAAIKEIYGKTVPISDIEQWRQNSFASGCFKTNWAGTGPTKWVLNKRLLIVAKRAPLVCR